MLKKGIVSSVKKVVTVDPYSLKSYQFFKNKFFEVDTKKIDKDAFCISYIQTKDVISSTIDISRGLSDEDLKDAIEVKVYDELGLEDDLEYSIFYFESNEKHDSDDRIFNVIVVDRAKLESIFENVKAISYIDYITTAPFLIKSLYNKKILDNSTIDCFLYFHQDDAFITIYQNGVYLFSKSIKYSLKMLSDTFSQNIGKRVDENEFFKMLKTSGLQNENSLYQQQLVRLFGEMFLYIKDVIEYAKRAYHIEEIDTIYIGSEIGNIVGIVDFCQSHINITTKKLEFKISKNTHELDIDPIHTLLTLTAMDYKELPDDTLNFSIFKRPPPFNKRPSGKLIMTVAATLVISLTYPIYQMVNKFFIDKKIEELNQEYQRLSLKANQLKSAFAKERKKKKEIEKKLVIKRKDLEFRSKLLKEIYSKKVNYPMKAKILTELFEKVYKHKSQVTKIDNSDKDLIITIKSTKNKYITELLKELADFEKYDISTELIKKDENTSTYISAIKVGLYGKF